MNTEWSLDSIYRGIKDPAYEADITALEKSVARFLRRQLLRRQQSKNCWRRSMMWMH